MANSVSVIIPVYNAEKYLEEAVHSVLFQKDNHLREILLVEDCSTDDSLALARRICSEHSEKCRLIENEDGINKGAGASRNVGIHHSKGTYICFLDADDYWLEDRLKSGVPIMEKDSTIDAVYDQTRVEIESTDPKHLAENRLGLVKGDSVPPCELFKAYLNGKVGWHTSGILIRSSSFEKSGVFDESLRLRQDGHLWYRMAACFKMARSTINKPVAVYRRHGANRFNPLQKYEDPQSFRESEKQVWDSLYKWFTEQDFQDQRWTLFFKSYMRGLGKIGCLKQAYSTALKHNHRLMFLQALRTYFPGPRRVANYLKYYWRKMRMQGRK